MPEIEEGLSRLGQLNDNQRALLRSLVADGSISCLPVPLATEPSEMIRLKLCWAHLYGYTPPPAEVDQDDFVKFAHCAFIYLDCLTAVAKKPRLWREFFLWSLGEPDFYRALASLRAFSRETGSSSEGESEGADTDDNRLTGEEIVIGSVRDHGYLATLFSLSMRCFIQEQVDMENDEFVGRLDRAVAASARRRIAGDPLDPLRPTSLPEAIRESWLPDCLWLMDRQDAMRRLRMLYPEISVSESGYTNIVGGGARGLALFHREADEAKVHWTLNGLPNGPNGDSHEWGWSGD